ncbi:MAG: pentapeptide repeat-containing protein [bacterium]
MEASELKEILEQHKLWIKTNGAEGKRANLVGANLTGAYLERANLERANLEDVSFINVNLYNANLHGANLRDANLSDADLNCAKLSYADLRGANLRGANLNGPDLSNAILPDISWIIPCCLVQLNHVMDGFYLEKERKWDNFIQDSLGFFIQDNSEEKTFDILAGDRVIRNIPDWVKYSGLKQIESV